MKNNINKHFSCKNLIRWVKPKWESLVGTDICPEAIGVTKIKRKTVKPCRKYSHRAISVNVESKTYRRQVFLQESIKERKKKSKSNSNSKINDTGGSHYLDTWKMATKSKQPIKCVP